MPGSNLVIVTTVNGVEVPAIGPNPRRKGLIFSSGNANSTYVRANSLGNNPGGLNVSNGCGPIVLSLKDHGDIVKEGWLAFTAAGGAANLGILETID